MARKSVLDNKMRAISQRPFNVQKPFSRSPNCVYSARAIDIFEIPYKSLALPQIN